MTFPYQEIRYWEMDEEESHPAPVPPEEAGPGQLEQRQTVGGQAQHEHHRVDSDGRYVGVSEHHVRCRREVRGNQFCIWEN